MKDFFKTKSFKALLITISILITASIISTANNSVLSSLINGLTVPFQGVTAHAADSINKKSYDELLAENEKLNEEIAQLRTQAVDYYDVKQENARLWKYYELKRDNPTYDLLPASVIRRDPNDDFYAFTLDKGISSGVSVNDIVVTEKGLVGWVYQVDAFTCKVKTILSPETKVGSIDKSTRDSGVTMGSVAYSSQNLTTLTKISASNTIKKGDIIVTNGISGIYPPNLIIGQVTELKYDDYDTSLYAVINPYENIKTVSDVIIITEFTGQGEILTKNSKENKTESTTQPSSSVLQSTQPSSSTEETQDENGDDNNINE